MTRQETLTAVLAMTPEQLTEKVADLKGLCAVIYDCPAPPPGNIVKQLDGWIRPGCDTFVHDSGWSPPDFIEHAWPLWEELPITAQLCKNFKTHTVILLCAGVGPGFVADEAPLAITRAWVWQQWCEKEGCSDQ